MNQLASFSGREHIMHDFNSIEVVDLHGYPVWEAVDLATHAIHQAWQRGDHAIMLIHGAPDIYHHAIASMMGRGGIKWSLRGCLARGEWSHWVYPRRSTKHRI